MAGFITQGSIEQVRAASDIVEVIGGVLPLKKAGASFVALCPFHKEKSPSFHVNPHKQIFYCFGCHKGGDVFTFIREFENIDFGEAVARLAERARVPLVYETKDGAPPGEHQQQRRTKELLLDLHEQITRRWQAALEGAGGEIARAYLVKRGVAARAIELFRIGYAADSWDDAVNWSRSRNFQLELVEQAGLVIRKEGGSFYDRFRGRLMFPICDEQGRVIGFSGRILSGDEKSAKYVNSPETPLFTKGRVIYGLDKAKRPMLDAQFAVVCEGQLDCIACHMAGVTNAVAPQGTAFTGEQARILKRYVNEVVLCFDADNAGQKATVRVLDDLLGSGLAIRVATVPAPHDPDSFIKANGPEAFREIISKAESFFDYYLNSLCAAHDVSTDKGQQSVVRAMAEAVRKTNDALLIDKYARKTAARMGANVLSATTQFKAASRRAQEQRPPAGEADLPSADEPSIPAPSVEESWLLKILLLDADNLEWTRQFLDLNWIAHPDARAIVALRLEQLSSGGFPEAPAILERLSSDSARQLLAQSCIEKRAIPRRDEQVKQIVRKLRNDFIDREMARLLRQSADPAASEEERLRLFAESHQLRQLKKQPFD